MTAIPCPSLPDPCLSFTKISGEKVDELAGQLKTQMLKYKTELETLSKQLQSTSTENNTLTKKNEMMKDAIDKILVIGHTISGGEK